MAGVLVHPTPLYRPINSRIINLLSYMQNHQMQEDGLEDHTESFPSTPSADFVSESQLSGLASTISLGNIASFSLM